MDWVKDLSYPEKASVEGEGWKMGRFSADTGNRNDYLAYRMIRYDGSESKLRGFYGESLRRHFESGMSKPPLSLQRFDSYDLLRPTPAVIRKIVSGTKTEERESLYVVYSIVMGDDAVWDLRGR